MSLPHPLRREALRHALPTSVDQLYRRRACDIPDGYIDDYVSLRWLEWHGGTLRLTPTGEAMVGEVNRISSKTARND